MRCNLIYVTLAQVVEHCSEKASVGGANPSGHTPKVIGSLLRKTGNQPTNGNIGKNLSVLDG